MDEIENIRQRYERRKLLPVDGMYSIYAPHSLPTMYEREREFIRIISEADVFPETAKVLEIGCGAGGNLHDFIKYGFSPDNIVGNDLLSERLEVAKKKLPPEVQLIPGDACTIILPDEGYDVVYISTVFSSILDHPVRKQLADRVWGLLKPGGVIIWYDFIFNNPKNKDVEKVTQAQLMSLFPGSADYKFKRITLAPPLSRAVCKISSKLYPVVNFFPFFRSHLMGWIRK